MYVRLYLYFARRDVWTTFVVVVSVKLLLFLLRFGTKATMSYLVDCNCLVSHAETMFLRWPMKLARILRFTKYKKRRQAILCDFQCAGNSWFFSLSICNGGETEVVRHVLLASGVSIIVLLLSCSHNGCDFVDNFHFVILHTWSSASVDGI